MCTQFFLWRGFYLALIEMKIGNETPYYKYSWYRINFGECYFISIYCSQSTFFIGRKNKSPSNSDERRRSQPEKTDQLPCCGPARTVGTNRGSRWTIAS